MPSLQKHKHLATVQEVTFHLPKKFEIPLILFSINETDFANILQSASKILEFQKQTAYTAQQDDFVKEQLEQKTAELKNELEQTKRQFEKEIRNVNADLKQAEQRIQKHQLENESLKAQNQTIKETIQATATEQSELRVQDFRILILKLSKVCNRIIRQKILIVSLRQ